VGSTQSIQVDARLISATNADLPALVATGQFKPDLLDRLSFEVLFLPPLRQRQEDILLLANHFAAHMAFALGRDEVPQFSDQALAALESYDWPGNVRELKNVVERAVYQANTVLITNIVFNPFQSPFASDQLSPGEPANGRYQPATVAPVSVGRPRKPLAEAVRETEIQFLQQALKDAHYNQRQAASLLGLTYHQFRGLYRKYKNALSEL
jgi:psp operon transcriptional activator